MEKIGAVITGDIIKSSRYKLEERELIRKKLLQISKELLLKKNGFSTFIPLPMDIFQGDSWQIVITSPEKSLRIGLFIRSKLKSLEVPEKVDSRFSIGIGEYLPLPERVTLGDGSAFVLSGRGLQNKRDVHLPTMHIDAVEGSVLNSETVRSMEIILALMDFIISEWTAKQAFAISGALLGWDSSKIARHWMGNKIERQAVSSHLRAAGWDVIRDTLGYFEEHLEINKDAMQPKMVAFT